MNLIHLRRTLYKDCVRGTFELPSGLVLHTLERPWLNNKRNVSCYPDGIYLCKWMPRSSSGKYKRVWHVLNVPNRGGILWHNGNLVKHSRGCTLVGMRAGKLGGKPAVLSSGTALNKMRRELGGKDFILYVTS